MQTIVALGLYSTAAGSLVAGSVLGLAMLTASDDVASVTSQSAATQPAIRTPAIRERAQLDTRAFRYGPEVNHGRSDTPVHATAAARKQASRPHEKPRRLRIVVRPIGHRNPAAGAAVFAQPSIPSSGH